MHRSVQQSNNYAEKQQSFEKSCLNRSSAKFSTKAKNDGAWAESGFVFNAQIIAPRATLHNPLPPCQMSPKADITRRPTKSSIISLGPVQITWQLEGSVFVRPQTGLLILAPSEND